jgi:predicted DNA-binding transcriptional regulator YafY
MESTAAEDDDFVPRIAAMYFAQQLMGFLQGTEFQDAFETLFQNFTHSLTDRPFVLNHLLRNADRIFYQVPDAPKDYSELREELQTVAHALIFSKVLEVTYDSPTYGELTLTLHPYSLMSYRSGLYLVALSEKHENDDPRIYSVDRIRAVEKLDRGFKYPSPARFKPETYTEGSFGIFRGDPTRKFLYELIFDNVRWLKMYVMERRWHPSQTFEELADGRLRMTFEVSVTDEVDRWVRSFGDEVDVVKNGVEVD